MATGPKLVHKQFNSPIGLYSQKNIQDTLSKHLQNLDNGTVGIDFSNPATNKPANLANSAVLRMLEEENQSRRGSPKKVVWPPTPETNGYHSQQQSPAFYNSAQHSPQPQSQPQAQYQPEPQVQSQYQQPQTQPQYQQPQYQPHQNQPQYQQPQYQPPQNQPHYQQPQYQPPQNQPHYQQPQNQPPQNQPQYQQPQYQPPQNQPQYYPESQPSYCEGKKQEPTGLSKLIPVGPGVTASRQGPPSPAYRPGPPSPGVAQPYGAQPSRWAPVPAPLSPQPQSNQQSYPQGYSPQPQQYSEPAYQSPQRQFEPPPSTITLRQQQPIHQKPPPVFASQPATASFQGGINMRGDQKWPPQEVKEAVAAENEARRQLAKGPACRPRKIKKDYASFFAKNALNQNYPGYRVPPGTQHYEELSGRSSY